MTHLSAISGALPYLPYPHSRMLTLEGCSNLLIFVSLRQIMSSLLLSFGFIRGTRINTIDKRRDMSERCFVYHPTLLEFLKVSLVDS